MIALLRVSLSLQAPIIPAKERHPANVIPAAAKLGKPGGIQAFVAANADPPAKAGIQPRFSSITEVWVR